MADPGVFASIDAGSNALRLSIAAAASPADLKKLENVRKAVRLGHNAFTQRNFDTDIMDAAVAAFTEFRQLFDKHRVTAYRAVTTSAARDAANREGLLKRIQAAADIDLEVIDGLEEARLVRTAVVAALKPHLVPDVIIDQGGGSMQLSLLEKGVVLRSASLPIGTVRILESLKLGPGAISREREKMVRAYTERMLRTFFPQAQDCSQRVVVACGGNAETLAALAPGQPVHGIPTIDVAALHALCARLATLTVEERMAAYKIRQDRAEVLPVAALNFAELAMWLNVRAFLAPGVGVRDGILDDLIQEHFGLRKAGEEAAELVQGAWQFARSLHIDLDHAENVRRLAASLFDQTQAVHGLPRPMRTLLEIAAILHDCGVIISSKSHHKHTEYIVRNADIAGLTGRERDLTACVARYHRKSPPVREHELYASFPPPQQSRIRVMAALLRIADGLDRDHTGHVHAVTLTIKDKTALFHVRGENGCELAIWGAQQKVALFEREFDARAKFVTGALTSPEAVTVPVAAKMP